MSRHSADFIFCCQPCDGGNILPRAQSSLHIQPDLADTHRDRVSEYGDHPMQRFPPCGPEPWDWRVILSRFHQSFSSQMNWCVGYIWPGSSLYRSATCSGRFVLWWHFSDAGVKQPAKLFQGVDVGEGVCVNVGVRVGVWVGMV